MQPESNNQLLLAQAIKRVLRPFVRLMLAHNLTYTFLIDILKTLFVEVADAEFLIDGKRQTDSRISLISGVHRKDVKRLREEAPQVEDVMPENVSLGSQIIAIWSANPRYLDEDGMPKPLMRFSQAEDDVSFESLVKSVSKDIHPRSVLDEWLRLGVASLDTENVVHLTTDAFVPQEGFAEKVYYFANNMHDHAQATVSNVIGGRESFLERCVHYDGLTQESVKQLHELTKKQGMKSLREVNKLADALATKDQSSVDANMRMTYGVYYYYESVPSNQLSDALTKTAESKNDA